jgi:signal transduction histidine kinase
MGILDRIAGTIDQIAGGSGLPAEELTRVFDRFYRADTPATRRAPGAGLGLYLAKSVIEAHGGRIWADSESGRGAAFSFSLPRE